MNLPATVDVALGLVVLYLLLSTVCSIFVELVGTWKGWRRKMLLDSINRLLTGSRNSPSAEHETVKAFWDHPLVQPLVPPGREAPSYMTPGVFAAVILDLGVPKDLENQMPRTAESLQRALTTAQAHPQLRDQLQRLLGVATLLRPPGEQSDAVMPRLQNAVATWYNEAMERLTGQYKRRAQQWLFWVGLSAAVLLNADSVRVAYILSTNDGLRQAVATYAVALSSTHAATTTTTTNAGVFGGAALSTNAVAAPARGKLEAPEESDALRHELATEIRQLQRLQAMGFPVGWQFAWETDWAPLLSRPEEAEAGSFAGWLVLALLVKLSGLAVTGLAVSLGAPFWYDVLNKLVSLRGSGARPSTETKPAAGSSPETASAPSGVAAAGLTAPAPGGTSRVSAAAPAESAPLDVGTDLARPEVAFSLRKGYWLAEMSLLAYERDGDAVRRQVCQGWFLQDVKFYNDQKTTQALLLTGAGVAVLAFRGTEPKEIADWLTDSKFAPKPWDPGFGNVHEGFAGALETVFPAIRRDLESLRGSGRSLYVTGHSLGAALATLLAARLAAQQTYPVQGVYTYGSPRVGDIAFEGNYTRLLGERTFRFVNHEDLVTRVPPRSLGFRHVGSIAYLDADGRLLRDIGFWYRFLNLVANAVEDLKSELQTAVHDHSMELYRKRLKELATPTRLA